MHSVPSVCRCLPSCLSRPLLLPQGDVGCGKTVVAFLALLAATGSGYQGAIMVSETGGHVESQWWLCGCHVV